MNESINQCYKIFKINLNLQTDGAGTPEIVELNMSRIPVTRY